MSDDDGTERAVFEAAADWLLRLNADGQDAELRQAFDRWLADPRHRAAWQEVQRTWDMLGAPEAARVVPVRPYRRLLAGGLTVAAMVALWLALPAMLLAVRAEYRTARAEVETVQMADGTSVDLAGASAIRTDLKGETRHVELLAGEAFFDVAADRARPFVVNAAGVEVTVHGTAFDVLVTAETTTVALLRGAVEAAPEATGAGYRLKPGERIIVDHRTGAARIEAVEAQDIGAWRDGRMFLSDMTLGEAAEVVGRYHPAAWIVIPDRALARQRVNALIDLSDPDAALALLAAPFGAKIHDLTPLGRVIGRF